MIRIGTTEDLADAVGLLRQLAGITQTAVAEIMGCHPARIGEYERHRRKVSVRVALIHLRALGYGLAIVPLDQAGPETALSTTESGAEAEGYTRIGAGESNGSPGESEGSGAVLVDDGTWTWRWTPTTDGGSYSGPVGDTQ